MDITKFPLHRLPKNAIVNVVKSMEMLDIISFSLCTETTGSLVGSLNMGGENFLIIFADDVRFQIRFTNDISLYISFYKKEPVKIRSGKKKRNPKLRLLRTPKTVHAEYGVENEDGHLVVENKRQWTFSKKEGLGFGDWRRHIASIFHNAKLCDILFMKGCEKFYLKDIKRHLDDFPEEAFICVDEVCANQYHHKIHRMFQPIKYLAMPGNPYESCELQRLICQNFEELSLRDTHPEWMKFDDPYTLDDLLSTNSLTIEINTPNNLSAEDIRRYIRLWMTGKTSRRTFYIVIKLERGIVMEEETILWGIQHTVAEEEKERTYGKFSEDMIITGGYDVRARDGTLATIVCGLNADQDFEMRMYVW